MVNTGGLGALAVLSVMRPEATPPTMADDGRWPRDRHPGRGREDRILTVPNLITLVRLLCIPLFLWLLFAQDARAWAALLLAFLGATDWVDGYVARHFHQVSNLGKAFDPIVDRLLLIVGASLSIIVADGCPAGSAWSWSIREVMLSAWVVGITALGRQAHGRHVVAARPAPSG